MSVGWMLHRAATGPTRSTSRSKMPSTFTGGLRSGGADFRRMMSRYPVIMPPARKMTRAQDVATALASTSKPA